MFHIDEFIDACLSANEESEPRTAIKAVLDRALTDPNAVAAALPPERAELTQLYVSPQLTILKVVWTPAMSIRPHDHRMWAAIGIYTGGEDNAFYRRADSGLAASGGRELRVGDSLLLGDDVIHTVTNPTTRNTGAIHIYGGDLLAVERSEWDPITLEEQPYDVAAQFAAIEEQNRIHAPESPLAGPA